MDQPDIVVRPTGVLIEDGKILITRQEMPTKSNWSLPGGKIQVGETIEQCLIREFKEETGLDVRLGDLLYVCDRFRQLNRHVIDMTFLVEKTGGRLRDGRHIQEDGEVIDDVRMVAIDKLPAYGFSQKFQRLVKDNFPNRGTYQGDFHRFYDEES